MIGSPALPFAVPWYASLQAPSPMARPAPTDGRMMPSLPMLLAALLLLSGVAGAQDTASVPKPVPPTPVRDTVARRDSASTPAPAKDSVAAPAPARDSVPSPAPVKDGGTAPAAAKDSAAAPTAPKDAAAAPAVVKDSTVLQPLAKDAAPTAASVKDSTTAAAPAAAPPPAVAPDSTAATAVVKASGVAPAAAQDSAATAIAAPAVPAVSVPAPAGATRDSAAATTATTPPAAAARADSGAVSAARVATDSVAATLPLPAVTVNLPPAAGSAAALTVQPTGSAAGARPASAPAEAAPVEVVNLAVQRADSLYQAGQHEAALSEYRRAIAKDPMDSDTWYALAETLHEMGRTKQASETYTLALTTIEHAPELRVPYAEMLIKTGKKAEAIKVLQRGIEIDPDASEEMKALLGGILMGALDAAAQPEGSAGGVASSSAGSAVPRSPVAGKAAPARSSSRLQNKKKKKLCNLFCPGSFPVAPRK